MEAIALRSGDNERWSHNAHYDALALCVLFARVILCAGIAWVVDPGCLGFPRLIDSECRVGVWSREDLDRRLRRESFIVTMGRTSAFRCRFVDKRRCNASQRSRQACLVRIVCCYIQSLCASASNQPSTDAQASIVLGTGSDCWIEAPGGRNPTNPSQDLVNPRLQLKSETPQTRDGGVTADGGYLRCSSALRPLI